MSNRKKNKLMLLLSLAAATSVSVGVLLANGDTLSASEALASFQMDDGAYVRATGQDKADNGLKYVVSMPKLAYEKVKSAYADVKFGVLIAPEEWLIDGYELTEENVFGDEAVYGYAEWNGNEWVYDGEKPQIVNLSSSVMETSAKDASRVEYGAAMVNIRDGVNDTTTNNLAREFRGVGYISYVDGTETKYVFVGDDDNVRSMTYVAQRALEMGAVAGEIATWVQQNYVDAVTDVATTYKVAHYLQQKDGSYALKETETVSKDVTIADDVTATPKAYDGYTYNAEKSVTTGKTYANGRLTLACYYDRMQATVTADLGLVDTSNTSTLDVSDYAAYIGENDLYLTATGATATANIAGNQLSLAGLNGAYTLRLASESGIAEISFDAYDGTQGVEWNEVTAKTGAVSARSADYALQNTTVGAVDGDETPAGKTVNGSAFAVNGGSESFAFNFLPLHTAAYYTKYAETYSGWGMQMSFDYYVAAEQGENATKEIATTMVGFANTEKWTEINVGEWYTVTVPFSTMLSGDMFETNGEFYQAYGAALRGDNACTQATWYFANFAITYETLSVGEILADVNGATTLEEALLTKNQQKAFALFATEGTLVWNVGGKNPSDLNELEGVYETKAILTRDGNEIVLYDGAVDFYNSADGMVWVPKNNLSTDDVYLKKTNATVSIAAEIPAKLKGEEYFLISSDDLSENKNFLFSVYSHSKAYYEMWQAEAAKSGSSFNVTFDVYYTTNAKVDYSAGYGDTGYYSIFTWGGSEKNNSGGSQLQMPMGTVNTLTVTLNSFMSNFDNFTNDKIISCGTFGNNFFGWKDLQENYVNANETTDKIDIQFYIGNFRTTFVNGVSVRDYSAETKLEKTDGVSGEYDLSALLSDDDKTAIGDRLGELTWKMNGVVVPSKVDVATLDGLYEITLSESLLGAYDIVYYKAKIDFYKEADGVVWTPTSGLKESDVLLKGTNAKVDIVKDGLPSALTAEEYYLVSSDDCGGNFKFSVLRHSKAYYQMWQAKADAIGATFTVSYDMYYTTTASIDVSSGYYTGTYTLFNFAGLGSGLQMPQAYKWTNNISLSSLISKYDEIVDENAGTYGCTIYWVDGATVAGKTDGKVDMQFYIGNFQTTFNGNSNVYINRTSTTALADLNGVETFDFTTLLSEDDATALSGLALTWKVNGVVVSDWANVEGVYKVTASTGFDCYDVLHYETYVDFYNSADGLVWQPANGLSADNVILKNSVMSKSVAYENLPTGATASEYFYITTPYKGSDQIFTLSITGIHTKAYYEMWQAKAAENNQTYSITYNMWYNSDSNTTKNGEGEYNYFYMSNQSQTHFYEQKWYTMTVTLDWLLTRWSENRATGNANNGHNWVYANDIRSNGDDCQMYIGNFQAVLNDVVS